MQPKWRLSHAQGYLGLGMVTEAAAELEKIPAPDCDEPAVLAVRLAVLQERCEWPALRAVAAEFVRRAPGQAAGWVTWAYATRRADSITAAEKILLEAEHVHPQEPTIQFNLGCYASQRGALAEARRRVDRAIKLDQTFAALAATDPDLEPLRSAGPPASSGA
jgi:predicted Zn-dependent protease